MGERIFLDGVFIPAINFSMQQNAVPVLRQFTIKNQTAEPIENIEINIVSSPEFVIPWHKHIDMLPSDGNLSLGAVNLSLIHISYDCDCSCHHLCRAKVQKSTEADG